MKQWVQPQAGPNPFLVRSSPGATPRRARVRVAACRAADSPAASRRRAPSRTAGRLPRPRLSGAGSGLAPTQDGRPRAAGCPRCRRPTGSGRQRRPRRARPRRRPSLSAPQTSTGWQGRSRVRLRGGAGSSWWRCGDAGDARKRRSAAARATGHTASEDPSIRHLHPAALTPPGAPPLRTLPSLDGQLPACVASPLLPRHPHRLSGAPKAYLNVRFEVEKQHTRELPASMTNKR
eukprot:scaffold4267_cov124-Isochrysis_galbana.AAC.3